jgi:uncharacterized protein (TIGR02466 family)
MNFEVINFFPTTAYIGRIKNHNQHKQSFYKVYPKFDWEEDLYNITVSENVGNPLLHLEPDLDSLFDEIINHIKNYAHNVLMLKDVFDFVITKTWISRSRQSNHEIPWHIHSTSHISFSYYINMPENAHSLKFSNDYLPNNLFLGMTKDHKDFSRCFVKEYNDINCETIFMVPNEGDVVIFPSKLTHSTSSMNDKFDGERLAIVGDITLVLKEEYLSYSMGYIHPKYWKTYK